jgi:mRNA interferase YafQ
MYEIVLTTRFKKDLKLAIRRGYDMDLLDEVVTTIADGNPLPDKNKDHALSGDYEGYRECHIAPDWLLIYTIDHSNLVLILTRTGSHNDLF